MNWANAFAAIVISFLSTLSFAAGLEKSTLWSGKYMGFGGAAASSVEGGESLYFNPAGLISGQGTQNLSV